METGFPRDFCCPISHEVMSDPVILPSGHTFDRSSIQPWLDSGKRTCPVTMLPLPPHSPLIPNHALRRLISSFAADSPIPPPAAADPATDAAAAKPYLPLSFPADARTLAAVLGRAKRDAGFRRVLAESGAASVLLRHAAAAAAADGDRPDLQELSLRILLHLSLDGDDARVGLAAEGAVDLLVSALRRGDGGSAASLAATMITSLAMVEVNKCTIGAHPTAIPSLVGAVSRDAPDRVRREAATALFVLCSLPENRRRAVGAGAVPVFARFAASGSERAVEVLGLLAKCPEGRSEMKSLAGIVSILTGTLKAASLRAVEHALAVLNILCSENKGLAFEAIEEGVPDICLGFLGEKAGNIASNAARLALVLQNMST